MTWCTGITGCRARSARWPRSGGACRWSSPCTRWARSRTRPWRRATRLEPEVRLRGEAEVIAAADRLIANTDDEARELISGYDAAPGRVAVINPGVSLSVFRPGSQAEARQRAGPARRRDRAGVRRAGAAAQGPGPGAARGGPDDRRRPEPGPPADHRVRRRPERGRPRRPGRADRAGRPAGPGRPDPARAAVPAAGAGQLVPRGDASSWCRRTPSPSGWSRWRPRPAARRWWRRRSAGCARRSGTGCPGSWSTPVTRPGTRGPSGT